MVRTEVMAVGRELLIGRTLNTNAHWIGRRMALMGTMIKQMTTADDDLGEISRSIKTTLTRRPDFVVVLGGLGPTPDDMTLKGIALGLGRRLVLNKGALSLIREHYAQRGMSDIEITPARKKMAVFPSGSRALPNRMGTAPGVRIEQGSAIIFCLPGVPVEMRSIFRNSVEPELKRSIGDLHRRAITLKFEGVYESAMAPLIAQELNRNPGTYIKSHPRGVKEGVSRIELDIVAVSINPRDSDVIALGIANEMIAAVRGAGGNLKSSKGLD